MAGSIFSVLSSLLCIVSAKLAMTKHSIAQEARNQVPMYEVS